MPESQQQSPPPESVDPKSAPVGDGVARDGPAQVESDDRYARLRNIYADYAPGYDRRFARYSRRTLDEAERAIARRPPTRLLDVACGTGLLGERLRKRWPSMDIVGVDLSPEMLARAAERLPPSSASRTVHAAEAARTEWLEGSAESLPVDDHDFDAVVCTNAFHLVQESDAALAEFRRVLRPGGRLIIVDWCRDFLTMRLLLMWLRVTLPQWRRVRSLDELRRELTSVGCDVVDGRRFRAGPVWGLMTVIADLARPAPDDGARRREGAGDR